MPLARIRLNLGLHPGQREVMQHPARFKVLAKGRRWGGSRLAAAYLLAGAVAGEPTTWIFPTYRMSTPQWRLIKRLIRPIPGMRKQEVERTVEFPNGGFIVFQSADRVDSLRGDGYKRAAVDEAAFLREESWFHEIRPSLSDLGGSGLILSSPKGQGNWFCRLYNLAKRLDDWEAWTFPTSTNPYIPASEIEEAKRSVPARVFDQEYLAKFLESGSGLFTQIMEQAVAKSQDGRAMGTDPETGEEVDLDHVYVGGLDLARTQDYTVLTVIDTSLEVPGAVYLDRFHRMSWRQQIARVKDAVLAFGCEYLAVDATGVGDPVTERLQDELGDVVHIIPVIFSATSKPALLEDLALAIEVGELEYIPDQDLVMELMAIETTVSPSGRARYGAPSSMHDDTVMSLALAWRATTTGRIALDIL